MSKDMLNYKLVMKYEDERAKKYVLSLKCRNQ